MNLTPKEIVAYLDEYVIGQDDAKKAIAIALRNRYRRMKLEKSLQEDISPKNILMIGSTGVGKTEIARRLAKMFSLPFVKVEASKYTEVGFVGRDVESMVRDLLTASINLTKKEHKEKNKEQIQERVEKEIIEKLLPPLSKNATDEKKEDYAKSFRKMKIKLYNGDLDHLKIEVKVSKNVDFAESNLPPEVVKMQESFMKVLSSKDEVKREVTVKEAKEILKNEASESLLDMEAVKIEAIKRAENEGIIFLDEIDKVVVSKGGQARQDPSKEGVQRDLLPIVEGSDINTKHGMIKSDHILFIAAGAFHVSSPSDLIPELQGRFPIRVELESLSEETLFKILKEPKNSLTKQYISLMKTEDVKLVIPTESLKLIASFAHKANIKSEDIGARRLHTILEKIMEDISFDANEHAGESIEVTKELIHEKLDDIIESEDLTKYIL